MGPSYRSKELDIDSEALEMVQILSVAHVRGCIKYASSRDCWDSPSDKLSYMEEAETSKPA